MLTPIISRAGKDKKQFRVKLIAENGEIVFISETYSRKENAKKAIALLKNIGEEIDLTVKKKKK